MKRNEFLISLLIYIPLGVILSYINYNTNKGLTGAIIFGFLGALCVFFVPLVFKNIKNKNK
jgi:hypothetical protein